MSLGLRQALVQHVISFKRLHIYHTVFFLSSPRTDPLLSRKYKTSPSYWYPCLICKELSLKNNSLIVLIKKLDIFHLEKKKHYPPSLLKINVSIRYRYICRYGKVKTVRDRRNPSTYYWKHSTKSIQRKN